MPQTCPHTVVLSEGQRRALERRAAAYSGPYRDVVRAKAVLLAADGLRIRGHRRTGRAQAHGDERTGVTVEVHLDPDPGR